MILLKDIMPLGVYQQIISCLKDGVPPHYKSECDSIAIEVKPFYQKSKLKGIELYVKGSAVNVPKLSIYKTEEIDFEDYNNFLFSLKSAIQPCSYEMVGVKNE